jgi:hypothetical protein
MNAVRGRLFELPCPRGTTSFKCVDFLRFGPPLHGLIPGFPSTPTPCLYRPLVQAYSKYRDTKQSILQRKRGSILTAAISGIAAAAGTAFVFTRLQRK